MQLEKGRGTLHLQREDGTRLEASLPNPGRRAADSQGEVAVGEDLTREGDGRRVTLFPARHPQVGNGHGERLSPSPNPGIVWRFNYPIGMSCTRIRSSVRGGWARSCVRRMSCWMSRSR